MARDLELLRKTLREFLPGGDVLVAVRPLPAGHSNETYLLEGLDQVLRMPPENGGILPPYDIEQQYWTLDALHAIEDFPPVPDVHILCTDTTVLGDVFFTMEFIDGEAFEYSVPDWLEAGDPAFRRAVWFRWIDAIAAVHRSGAQDLVGQPLMLAERMKRWQIMAVEAKRDDVADLLAEVAQRTPSVSGPPTLLHGDPKLANCMWNERGELTGLLDWELSFNGDPLNDLAFITALLFPEDPNARRGAGFELPGVPDRAAVIKRWESRTGRSAEGLRLYEAAATAQYAAMFSWGAALYERSEVKDERLAHFGMTIEPLIAYTRALLG